MKEENKKTKKGNTLKLKLELGLDENNMVKKEIAIELSDEELSIVSGGLNPPTVKTYDYDDDIKDKV